MEDIFSQIAAAGPTSGARYQFIDNRDAVLGDYVLEIDVLKEKKGAVDKAQKFIGEFKVLVTPNEKQAVGSKMQWFRCPSKAKFPQTELAELRELAAASAGMDPATLTAQDIKDAFSTDNPCRGRTIKASVFKKPSGFVTVRFSPTV